MRIVVLGAQGWLGSRYVQYLSQQPNVWVRGFGASVDVTSTAVLVSMMATCRPDVVINAAGRTHSRDIPNIDGCIASQEERARTMHVNAVGAANVAKACDAYGAQMVQLSSGCIFDGDEGPFVEDDEPNPPSYYAETKVLGEKLIQAICPEALILRIRMPISAQPHPRNLVTKLAAAKRVIDVVNSVTVVEDLIEWTYALIQAGTSGIVHAVHPQPITFRKLMSWYRQIVDPTHHCTFVRACEYKTADGRSNCTLASTKELPVLFNDTEFAVKRALMAYAEVHAYSR